MNVSDIVALARKLTMTDSRQVTDTDAVSYLNIVYSDLWSTIAKDVNEDAFFHTWYVNTLAYVNTYGLPVSGSGNIGMLANLGVSIQYHAGEDYRKLRQSRLSALPSDLDSYRQYENIVDPFFVLSDDYVMVYPEPTESVIAGLKIYGHRTYDDLTISSVESGVGIPREFHALLAIGMKRYIFASRGMSSEERTAATEYAEEKDRMVTLLSEQNLAPIESTFPDLSHLE